MSQTEVAINVDVVAVLRQGDAFLMMARPALTLSEVFAAKLIVLLIH